MQQRHWLLVAAVLYMLTANTIQAQQLADGDEAAIITRAGSTIVGEIIETDNDSLVLRTNSGTALIALSDVGRVDVFPRAHRGSAMLFALGGFCIGMNVLKGEQFDDTEPAAKVGVAMYIGTISGIIGLLSRQDQPAPYSISADSTKALVDKLASASANKSRFRFTVVASFTPNGSEDALTRSAREAGLVTDEESYNIDPRYDGLGSASSFVAPFRAMQFTYVFAPWYEVGLTFVDVASSTFVNTNDRENSSISEGASGLAIMAYGGITKRVFGKGTVPVYVNVGIAAGAAPVFASRVEYVPEYRLIDTPNTTLATAQATASVQLLVGGAMLVGFGYDYLWTSSMELPRISVPYGLPARSVSFSNGALTFTIGVQL